MLNFGMPTGFAEALANKYNLMRLTAESQARSLDAATALDTTKNKLLPGETQAGIAKTNAETGNILTTTKLATPLATAQIGLLGSQANNFDASAGLTDEETLAKRQLNKTIFKFGMGNLFGGGSALRPFGALPGE